MRDFLEKVGRIAATLAGLIVFVFCFFQLVFVTKVVTGEVTTASASQEEAAAKAVEKARDTTDNRPLILVDPGHGGTDGGAVSGDLIEKHLALTISKKLVSALEADGRFRVMITRDDDTFVPLEDRAQMANDLDVALLVSVHLNSIDLRTTPRGITANGIETWYAWPKPVTVMLAEKGKFGLPSHQKFIDDRGELLASSVQEAACAMTGARSRGVKNKGHMVTRMVGAPAVLIECGFLTNPQERARIVDGGYQTRLAAGIANGIFSYLESAMADPMYGIHMPVLPEKDRILSQSGDDEPE